MTIGRSRIEWMKLIMMKQMKTEKVENKIIDSQVCTTLVCLYRLFMKMNRVSQEQRLTFLFLMIEINSVISPQISVMPFINLFDVPSFWKWFTYMADFSFFANMNLKEIPEMLKTSKKNSRLMDYLKLKIVLKHRLAAMRYQLVLITSTGSWSHIFN